ncbi:hypothetical protein [Brevibacillus sp. NRS-1366]|uniref:hypothetical protein n=1 Tax=Brevibacillus sp. NRS-1366 TaxID=3233899 RepID=UPI003D210814
MTQSWALIFPSDTDLTSVSYTTAPMALRRIRRNVSKAPGSSLSVSSALRVSEVPVAVKVRIPVAVTTSSRPPPGKAVQTGELI